MSRHHILPPIVYTPTPPKPQKAERRRGVWSVKGKRAADGAEATEETGESFEDLSARDASSLPGSNTVDATERRIHSTSGHLSESTLKAMLELQEQEDTRVGDGANTTGNAAGLPAERSDQA